MTKKWVIIFDLSRHSNKNGDIFKFFARNLFAQVILSNLLHHTLW